MSSDSQFNLSRRDFLKLTSALAGTSLLVGCGLAESLSAKEQLAYDIILGIVDRYIQTEVDWSQYTILSTLGMNEIALKKGHRDFVVIVIARLKSERIVLLGVLENRRKETVVEFLRSIPERLKRSIVSACWDMHEGFTGAIREELPHMRLVIDRFHVARAYRDGLDSLRKAKIKCLKREPPQQEYKALKGSMWALRKEIRIWPLKREKH